MKLIIILPAFNEELSLNMVLDDIRKIKIDGFKKEIVVVNDGSTDRTAKVAAKNKATVLNHIINRGLGGALSTGLKYARQRNADIAVTFDADGQHKANDIQRLVEPIIKKKADIVIGSRQLRGKNMPLDRKIINYIANLITYALFNVLVSDSQSGLRAFSKKALGLIEIRTNRMEVSSEILRQVKVKNLKLKEVPIQAIYTQYSKLKGQKNINALNVLLKMVLYKFNKNI